MLREAFLPTLKRLWSLLELRILVAASLLLQIVLIATGNRRKYTTRKLLAAIIWLSYLCADSVATLALGALSKGSGKYDNGRYTMKALWAPFLLMHLGGPDTITAFALADNELWARHLLGLATQVVIALYIFYRSWSNTPIDYLWIPVFVSGLVKYGERSWVLFSASRDRFRESMVSKPDAGPHYAKFIDDWVSKELEGYRVSLCKVSHETTSGAVSPSWSSDPDTAANVKDTEAEILKPAHYFFHTFKKLFADLILSQGDRQNSLSFFNDPKMTSDKAFKVVEVELGLVYDLFYTKAFLLYSHYKVWLRSFSCSATIGAFVGFTIINKNVYPRSEVIITYILFIGAIAIEIYAVMIFLSSDRMMIRLHGDWATMPEYIRKSKNSIVSTISKIVSLFQKLHIVPAKKRWCDAIGQYNVLTYCLEEKPMHPKLDRFLRKYIFWKRENIPKGLKVMIFKELRKRAGSSDYNKKSHSYWVDKFLPKEKIDNIDEVEFDQSVLLWHMATDFCYHTEVEDEVKPNKKWLYEFHVNEEAEESSSEENSNFKRETSILLSNYMMHLLIMFPFLLPSGIGQIRFQDTCAEVKEYFFLQDEKLSQRKACQLLLQVDARVAPSKVKGDRSKSLLFDACRLAKVLQRMEVGKRWEEISKAWLNILTYAAAECKWNNHAERLSQGGELLTHVWLLMAHFGMAHQFQISQGYVRAKLDLK